MHVLEKVAESLLHTVTEAFVDANGLYPPTGVNHLN